MLPMTSPNDPVFFMHHCMVDKVWHEWQLRFPNQGYLPMSGGPFGQNLSDPMNSTPVGPIGNRPIDVLDSAALDIEYDAPMPGTPGGGAPTTDQELSINGPTVVGEISSPGEIDVYTFDVTSFGTYTIETSGNSDTVMTLFGPDSPGNELAINDDGGAAFNSRISMNLSAGNYLVRIRLFNAAITGSYSIGLTSAGSSAVPQLLVDGPMLDAAISAGNESDLYRFEVQSPGTYVIETRGETDTFLSLFGPDSQTTLIADDDDGGFRLSSRIERSLTGGEYFVRVRHFSTQGTGPYQVSVRAV